MDDLSSVVLAAQYIDLFPWTAFDRPSAERSERGRAAKGRIERIHKLFRNKAYLRTAVVQQRAANTVGAAATA